MRPVIYYLCCSKTNMRKTNETSAPKYYKCFHISEILPLILLYMLVIKLLEVNKKNAT